MFKKLLIATSLICAASTASAAVLEYDATITDRTTNFNQTVSLGLFDTLGGTRTLTSVEFSVDGTVSGLAKAESLDATATTIQTSLSAVLSLSDASSNVLVSAIPSVSNTFAASSFDGSIDFAGTSGISYTGLTANSFASASYTDSVTLASFTGTGSMDFIFGTVAAANATGAGNIVSQFNSSASGLVKVIYTFTEMNTPVGVSAPGHLAFLGLGLLGFAGLRNARNK